MIATSSVFPPMPIHQGCRRHLGRGHILLEQRFLRARWAQLLEIDLEPQSMSVARLTDSVRVSSVAMALKSSTPNRINESALSSLGMVTSSSAFNTDWLEFMGEPKLLN